MDGDGRFSLKLVGPFGLFTPAGVRVEISSKKAIALLALLAAAPDGERTRVWLYSMLWGSRDTPQAQSSLRRELSTLHQLLEAHDAGDLLTRSTQRVRLDLDRIDIDLLSLAMGAAARPGDERSDFLEGIDLRGCDEFEDWLRDQRARLDALREVEFPQSSTPLTDARTVLGAPLPPQSELLGATPPRLPPKPSVAVLPFIHLGRPEETNWLGQGIAHEVGMTLTQFPQLFVVSTNSAAVLVQRRLTHVEIARQLGVRYLLDGTIREAGDRLRTSVSLLDGQSGLQVWSWSTEGRRDDLFSLQEAVATMAAPQIWTQIDLAERHRILRQPQLGHDSYELYWRANALFRSWEREPVLEALRLTDELTATDPACPLSAGLAAFCNGVAFAFRWTGDPAATRRRAIIQYQNALRHGADNVESLGYVAGTLISIGGDLSLADRIIAHALSLLPAHQPTLFWGGWVDIATGRATRARERLELALRINPASGVRAYALTGIGIANLFEGDNDAAFAMLSEAAIHIAHYPVTIAALAVAAARRGDWATARDALAALEGADGAAADALAIFQDPGLRAMVIAELSAVQQRAAASAEQL